MRKTSNFFRIFATLAFLFVFGLQSNKSFAECETIRNIKDDCKDCDYPGAIWVGSNKKKNYDAEFDWNGTAETMFKIVPFDENGNEVDWPYPIGSGYYVAIKSVSFFFEDSVPAGCIMPDIPQMEPTQEFNKGWLATNAVIHCPAGITSGHFKLHVSYALYLMNYNGVTFSDATLEVPGLRFELRPVTQTKGSISGKKDDYFVCTDQPPIKVTSPCTIEAQPLIVNFGDHYPREISDKPIKPNKPTIVTISCGNKVKRNIHLTVSPANPPTGTNNYATLVHTDSNQPFNGLGLIYKFGKEPTSCDQGQAWGESFLFGDTGKDSTLSGPIWWGLCRAPGPLDMGEFRTTATIQFWVD